MLAKISPPSPSPLLTPAPPSFNATFNPSPDPPASNQFFLNDGSVDNLIVADDGATEISITITLIGGAIFSSPHSIVWSLSPKGVTLPDPPGGGISISFTIPAPTHILSPWAFRFIADVDGVSGVRSQTIYIAKPLGTDPHDTLMYSGDTGGFVLMAGDDSTQVGPILGEELVLVNVYGARRFSVSLENDPSSTSTPSLSFATAPIVWSSGEQPDWIHPPNPSTSATELDFHFGDGYFGQSIGLQFAIMVTPEGGGETVQILSPDPILINATIGDGG